MKQRSRLVVVVAAVVAAILGGVAYSQVWSAQAEAKKVSVEFFTAAVHGDEDAVHKHLAADAKVTAAELVAMYSEFRSAHVASVMKALPNQSGVEYVIIASGDVNGFVKSTIFLVRRDGGRWVVVDAGNDLRY